MLALICAFLLIIVNFLHCHEKNTRGWGVKREARKMMKKQKRRGKKAKAVPWEGEVVRIDDSVLGARLF